MGGQPSCWLNKELRTSHRSDIALYDVDYNLSDNSCEYCYSPYNYSFAHDKREKRDVESCI
jgi:hypothetical protein